MTRTRCAAYLIALCAALSCGGPTDAPPPPAPPEPGHLTLSLASPATDDGAMVLEMTGNAMGSVAPVDTTVFLLADSTGGGGVRVVLAGNLVSGPLLSFSVPDVHAAYRATLLQVGDRGSHARADLTKYSLTISH